MRLISAFASDRGEERDFESSYPRCQVTSERTPSWATTTYADTSKDLSPLESSNLALEDQFCGWLWMRGGRFGRWRHRYFCLDGTMLSYFTSFPAEVFLKQAQASVASAWASRNHFQFGDSCQPRGVIRVAHIDDTDRTNRVGFKVYGSCGKVIDIRAHDNQERNRWLRALKTPARRKSRSWSIGSSEEITLSMSSFDPDGLCRFDRLSIPVAKSGWMEKRSSFIGLWRRYFFVIQGSMLSYYDSDKPYEVPRWRGYVVGIKTRRRSGTLVLPTAGATMAPPTQELVISLDSPHHHVLHVRFRSVEEARDWRRVLRANVRNNG
ncbi:hypothetical protein L915_17806 [Plasmopara halstedii]|uniref:PH domain-containing protein n=1 Tax=Plasmopara halstedii TaxID=4781 RepID=A0A0P1ABQ1_PLAHL|nr:hypothetical protein L915_17806 [Plasmopara halstedii]CEG37770.1 hypothetical protein L915_17806 [Plasmopara halstedii]|eukprot:XP_024574139.1 hypothetical protein L915_17806 [Plasmopara halstedii]